MTLICCRFGQLVTLATLGGTFSAFVMLTKMLITAKGYRYILMLFQIVSLACTSFFFTLFPSSPPEHVQDIQRETCWHHRTSLFEIEKPTTTGNVYARVWSTFV